MLRRLAITNFRAFPSLVVDGLERVNLFVGKNNSGKTSVLEAVEILSAGGNPTVLWRSPRRRGELSAAPDESRGNATEIEIRHLFHGHGLRLGSSFSVESSNGQVERASCEIVPAPQTPDEASLTLFPEPGGGDILPALGLKFSGSRLAEPAVYPLASSGALAWDVRRRVAVPLRTAPQPFLGTEGADIPLLSQWWDSVVLTKEEERVVETLRIIEPDIERIAFAGREGNRFGTTAFVKMNGSEERLPLGSMGDGIRRLLAISLYLARAAGGVLLVDEIDTGLHHSVMERLWALVVEGARRLDVQVFATSHSGDCVRALAWLNETAPNTAASVALHRIERGALATTRYSSHELDVAARHHIEVRG